MIKKLFVLFVFFVLATPIYAGQEEDHQSCMKAITQGDKPEDNTPEYNKFNETMCDCLVAKTNAPEPDKDGKKISKSCFFNALLHYATDDLDTDTTDSDMMTACKNMLNVNKEKASDDEIKMVADFCQCAQPKLMDLFKQYDSMTDKQYDDGLYSISESCSANIEIK